MYNGIYVFIKNCKLCLSESVKCTQRVEFGLVWAKKILFGRSKINRSPWKVLFLNTLSVHHGSDSYRQLHHSFSAQGSNFTL